MVDNKKIKHFEYTDTIVKEKKISMFKKERTNYESKVRVELCDEEKVMKVFVSRAHTEDSGFLEFDHLVRAEYKIPYQPRPVIEIKSRRGAVIPFSIVSNGVEREEYELETGEKVFSRKGHKLLFLSLPVELASDFAQLIGTRFPISGLRN